MPWLRHLVTGPSPWRPRFIPRTVRFVLGRVIVGHVLWFFPFIITQPMFYIDSYICHHCCVFLQMTATLKHFFLVVTYALTFRNLASSIKDGRKITLQMPHFIFIQQISVLNILNILYNLHFFLFKIPFIS